MALPLPAIGIAVGRASRGLCGGMVFTALDVFTAGLPPFEGGRPDAGSPLYNYIVRRLFDSFNLPRGVAKYYQWMLTANGDRHPGIGSGRRRGVRSLAWRTIVEEWPVIKADLDAGRPCPLGLVTVRSANPAQLGRNHQVLACGYQVSGQRLTITVYDPNTPPGPGTNDVMLALNLADPRGPAEITHNIGIRDQVRGLFRVGYRPTDPASALQNGPRPPD